ncbi:MAG TPA: hypothetical protein VK034_23725, partial [Enhygromyxa sp.]|nr:hypothetical protein [Enhygromyxa sp.]
FCPPPGPIEGVAARDYIMLPGGHSSLVVAEPFYLACREFFDVDRLDADAELEDDEDEDMEYVFERVPDEPLRLVVDADRLVGYDGRDEHDEHDAAE